MNKVLLFAFFSFPFLSQSQESFFKIYDVWSNSNYGPSSTFVLPDSSVITTFNYGYQFFIMKTDINGLHEWATMDSSNSFINRFYANKIVQCRDGKFLVSGRRYINGSPSGNSSVMKIDTAGNIVWNKTYVNFFEPGFGLDTTRDEGFIITGYTHDTTVAWSASNLAAIRADSMGNVLWCKEYISDSISNFEKACIQTDDGGFLFISHSGSIKVDSAGNVLHSNWFYTNTGYTEKSMVIRINDNTYAFIAFQNNLSLYDSTGNLKWKLNRDYKDIIRLSDSTFLLLGRGGWIWPGTSIQVMDTNGIVNSEILYELPYQIFPEKFALMADGRYVVTGLIDLNQLQYYQLFIMKTMQNGYLGCDENTFIDQPNFIPDTLTPYALNSLSLNCSTQQDTIVIVPQAPIWQDTLCYQMTSNHEFATEINRIEIFPNPSTKEITLKSMHSALVSLEIWNLLGDKVSAQTFSSTVKSFQTTLDISSLNSGIYFVKIETKTGTFIQKLIKQ